MVFEMKLLFVLNVLLMGDIVGDAVNLQRVKMQNVICKDSVCKSTNNIYGQSTYIQIPQRHDPIDDISMEIDSDHHPKRDDQHRQTRRGSVPHDDRHHEIIVHPV